MAFTPCNTPDNCRISTRTWSPGDDATNGYLIEVSCASCGRKTGPIPYEHQIGPVEDAWNAALSEPPNPVIPTT